MVTQISSSLERDQNRGFIFAFFAALSFASMALFAKLAVEVSPFALLFFRNFLSFLIILPSFLKKGSFKTKNIKLFIIRALLGFTCLSFFFYATKHLPLVDSVLLINTCPLFIPMIILMWDRMKISKSAMISIFIGFLGVIFILKPRFEFFSIAGLIGLFSGIFMAGSAVTLRKLSKTETFETILFYFFLGNMLLSSLPMIGSLKNFSDSLMWVYLLATGIMGFFFQYFTTKAYTYTTPTRVSVISYFSIVISAFYGWVIWGNIPDYTAVLGALLIISGGILVIFDKRDEVKVQG